MSKIYSPKIITDSLVMCLDASQNKSYPAADLPIKDRLNLWLDAADDTTFSYSSGTTISQWRDKSGLNNHAIVGGGSPVRSVAINSRKAVSFTSTSWFRCLTGSFNSTATHFLVCRATTSSATYQRVYNGGADAYIFMGGLSNNIATFWGTGSSWIDVAANSPSTTILNTLRIISVINNGSTGTPYYDGTAMSTKTTTNSGAYIGYELNSYSGGNTAQALIGEVCEIIVFNRVLSTAERRLVHTYLGQKWGISNTDRSIIDLSGNGINPEMSNTIFSPYNSGVIDFNGKAIGTNAVSVMKTTTSLIDRADGQEITVSCWIKPLRTSGQYSVFCTNRSDNDAIYNWIFYQHTTDGAISFHGDNQNKSSYVPTVNQWVNVVATVTGAGLLTLYINGASNYTVSGYTYGNGTPSRLGIGADPSSAEGFQGSMGQTLIYNRALSAAEVAQNYEAQKSKFANTIVQQGLVLNIDAGNPFSYAGAGTTWYDVSGTGNDFTIQGNVTWDATNGFSNFNGNSTGSGNKIYRNSFPQNLKTSQGGNGYTIIVVARSTVFGGWRKLIGNGDGENYIDLYQNITGATWHQDGSGETLYVDGVQVNNDTYVMDSAGFHFYGATNLNNGSVTNPAYALTIGNEPNSSPNGTNAYPWIGNIAIVLMYNRVLTTTELLQNYNATKGRFGL